MWLLIKNWKIISSSKDSRIESLDCETVKINPTDEEIKKIELGYDIRVEDQKITFIDSAESLENEKKLDIEKYGNLKKEISEIKNEISEIEETYNTYNDQGKKVADIRLLKLKEILWQLREKKNNLVTDWVDKYGDTILNDLI
jgi:hypothetical protein